MVTSAVQDLANGDFAACLVSIAAASRLRGHTVEALQQMALICRIHVHAADGAWHEVWDPASVTRQNCAREPAHTMQTAHRTLAHKIHASAAAHGRCNRSGSQVLGVPPGAAEADVRRRFRQMAPRVHPDKCRLPRAEDAFKLLNTAVMRLLLPANGYAQSCPVQPCLEKSNVTGIGCFSNLLRVQNHSAVLCALLTPRFLCVCA